MPWQAIWAKGYTELLDLVEKDSATSDMHTHIDCYGYGDDLHEVRLWLLRSCQISLLTLHIPGLVPHHHSSKGKKAEARLISLLPVLPAVQASVKSPCSQEGVEGAFSPCS